MCSGSRRALPKGTVTVNALAHQHTFNIYCSAMELNQFLSKRHANARAFVRPTLAGPRCDGNTRTWVCRQYVARSALDSKELPWF